MSQLMTSTQRVKAALDFQKPDFIPLIENYLGAFVAAWRQRQGLQSLPGLPFEDVVEDFDISSYYGVDVAISIPNEDLWPSEVRTLGKDGRYVVYRDGWGRMMRGIPGSEFAAKELEVMLEHKRDLDSLVFESPKRDDRYKAYIERVTNLREGDYIPYTVTKVGGPFYRPSRLRGYIQWFVDIAQDREFVRALTERVTDHLISVGIEAVQRSGLLHTSIWIFDDCAHNEGLLVSPNLYESVFLPQIGRMVTAFKNVGVARVVLHSDGDIGAILDGLVDVGIDAINPVEPRAHMDVVELRRRYGTKLSFFGGLCNSMILPHGTPDEVRTHVERVLGAGKNGGLIIGSHSIGPDISLERHDLVMRILAEHGRPLGAGE